MTKSPCRSEAVVKGGKHSPSTPHRQHSRLEKVVAQADPTAISGKADTTGEESEACTQLLRRGSDDSMCTTEAHATRETR